jgi:hypothetical protein
MTTSGTVQAVEWALNGGVIGYEEAGDTWTMNPDGSSATCLTCADSIGGTAFLTWSPSSKKIAFNYNDDLYYVNVKTHNEVPVTNTSTVAESECSWSPDGKWIACSDGKNFRGDRFELIPVKDGVERFKSTNADERQPAWRPVVS